MSASTRRAPPWPLLLLALGLLALGSLLVYGLWALATTRREVYNLFLGLLSLAALLGLGLPALRRKRRRRAAKEKRAAG